MLIFSLAIFALVFASLPAVPHVKLLWERAPQSMNFLYTIIATAIGVYLSIHAMDLQGEAADKADAKLRIERVEAILDRTYAKETS